MYLGGKIFCDTDVRPDATDMEHYTSVIVFRNRAKTYFVRKILSLGRQNKSEMPAVVTWKARRNFFWLFSRNKLWILHLKNLSVVNPRSKSLIKELLSNNIFIYEGVGQWEP